MIKGILFDLDGTLINTYDLYLEAYRLTARPYLNKDISEMEILKMKPTTERNFIEMVSPEAERNKAYERFLESYKHSHDSHFKGDYKGIPELLETLRDSGYRIGLVTGKSREAWDLTRKKIDLGNFEVVITDNDVIKPKPDPEGIQKALKMMKMDVHEVMYVGDSLVDYQAAKAANVLFSSAMWAKNDHEANRLKNKIEPDGSTLFLNAPAELLEHLQD